MAFQKGILKLKGTLAGLIFYRRKGKDLIRTTGSLNRDRIMNDPAFQRTRENMAEFTASARVGQALRHGLGTVPKNFRDHLLVPRVVKAMKAINAQGNGPRGQRPFDVVRHNHHLLGLEFNESHPLSASLTAPYTLVTNTPRNQLTLTLPPFDPASFINAPAGATHFRFHCAIATLCNYAWHPATASYQPTDPAHNTLSAHATSSEIPLHTSEIPLTVLTPQFPTAPTLPSTTILVAALGIEYLQHVNTQYHPLSTGHAMKLVQVF